MSFRLLLSLILAAVLLTACGNDHDIRTRIDGDWHRQTLEKDHLERWLKVLPTTNGFFNTAVTRDWQVLDPQPGDLVGHTRGIYLMAAGHELTGKPAYLEQVKLGTDFIDNQTGIMTSNDGESELTIENSLFADAPRQMHSLPHLLYVGRIAEVRITGSRFEQGYRGHLIKSRARRSDIRDNHIVDGPDGEASYEIDLPNGGIAHISGNTIGQSAKTQNPVLIAYGAEGNVWPENELRLIGNTLINEYFPAGWFLRVYANNFPSSPKVQVEGNRTRGLGIFTPDAIQTILH